jgi:hypothetical protein
MTEAEWLDCSDPTPMLEFLRGKASDRKLRMFACTCCRTVWKLLTHEGSRSAIEVAEQFADGGTDNEDLSATHSDVDGIMDSDGDTNLSCATAFCATATPVDLLGVLRCVGLLLALQNVAWRARVVAADRNSLGNILRSYPVTVTKEQEKQCLLLRDIIGNPFRSIALDPSWLLRNDGTVRRIAEGIYEERRLPEGTLDGARLAILSDALLDAGCDNEDLIAHCRSPGPHVRGCWAIDLLTGRA